MKKILVINGPNLNLLGKREPGIYGTDTLENIAKRLTDKYNDIVELEWAQSNHEGDIIDMIHRVGFDEEYLGIVLNAGAYTHTSLAIADAIAAVKLPVVEVHLSNVMAREEIRHRSLIGGVCRGTIAGFGAKSYDLGIAALLQG